ncbi:MAG: transglycosylase SLT domain-containing protein, partial [Acidobacteria bacterium]|nr:transglycosylase SLT domain-containing protein [Acidobacteriota bacterium]
AWLQNVTADGAQPRTPISAPVFVLGRTGSCDLVIDGEGSAFVSGRHCEITRREDQYWLIDKQSRNGTLHNSESIEEVALQSGDIIQLGKNGPRFRFLITDFSDHNAGETLQFQTGQTKAVKDRSKTAALVQVAVHKAREARDFSQSGQTHIIMADVVRALIDKHHRRHRITLLTAGFLLLSVCAFFFFTVRKLNSAKDRIDAQLTQLEIQLAKADDPDEMEKLIQQINDYQRRAMQIQRNLLYELGKRDQEADTIESEIKSLLKEFGANEYSIPPEFHQQVRYYISRYKGPDREHMENALTDAQPFLMEMKAIFKEQNLPPDLAYMALVESGLKHQARSEAGAVGLWQFLPATARAYGLKVNKQQDDRLDPKLATYAASRYIRDLILEFGTGSSIMLALAAYNLGPTRVRGEIRKVSDPIKQRNFWYLYRIRALPEETREYVPKIIAVILIGRAPDRFGFQPSSPAPSAPGASP